jgi:hypothetical protein
MDEEVGAAIIKAANSDMALLAGNGPCCSAVGSNLVSSASRRTQQACEQSDGGAAVAAPLSCADGWTARYPHRAMPLVVSNSDSGKKKKQGVAEKGGRMKSATGQSRDLGLTQLANSGCEYVGTCVRQKEAVPVVGG